MDISRVIFMAWDVGKTNDFSAICVAEPKGHGPTTTFNLRLLERRPLNESYVVQVERLVEIAGNLDTLLKAQSLAEKPNWVRLMEDERPSEHIIICRVDITGVGRGPFDFLKAGLKTANLKRVRLVPVNFVAGDKIKNNPETGVLSMGKQALVDRLTALAQVARISSPPGDMTAILQQEMRTYVTKNRTGNSPPEVGALGSGTNDDVITAAGLACLTDAPPPAGTISRKEREQEEWEKHWSRR